MKLVVYTALIGEGWTLKDPTVVEPKVRYVCFTDRGGIRSNVWEVRKVNPQGDPRMQCRHFKCIPWAQFPHAEYSVWLDSKFTLMVRPSPLVEHWLENWDMVALRHPDRDTIQEEAHAISQLGMLPREKVDAQAAKYAKAGFNRQRALTSTGICIRRHSPVVRHFGELWWEEIKQGLIRDQMSVDYCAWVAGLKIGYMVGHYRDNPYTQWTK